MSFFREFPNLIYPSFMSERFSSLNTIEVKNIFRRIKLRDDLKNNFTVFNYYQIPMGYRPDMVADEEYGSPELDWVVIITSGIINVRNEWPLSDKEVYDFALEKYGTNLNNVKYYETKEIITHKFNNFNITNISISIDPEFFRSTVSFLSEIFVY